MLTADFLDVLPDSIVRLYTEYEDSVILDIARRLAKLSLDSAAWQVQRLSESGMLYQEILKKLAVLTGKSEAELKTVFTKAGVKAIAFDDSIYKAAGLNPLPLNMSPAMAQVLAAGLQKTNQIMHNLTMSTAISGQQAFLSAADLAYMQVSQGAMSYTQAITAAIKKIAVDGLNMVQYPTGRKDQIDVATRRAVLTGVSQTTGQLQLTRADEMRCDLVETSAHAGARPTHQEWQGRVFSRSGKSNKFPDFVQSTGYGEVDGLCGINCRHSFYPFFEGISERLYTEQQLNDLADKKVIYNGQEMSLYDATQYQREIERKIRYWKRQAAGLEVIGQDNTAERLKLGEWQAKMRDFTSQTKLIRQSEREQVSGISVRGLIKKPETKNIQTTFPAEIQENPEAREAAKNLLAKRTSEEPGITTLVTKSVENSGGRMEGLEFRLKSEDSLSRKIAQDMVRKGIFAEEAAKEIKDVNRYTGIFDNKTLIKKALQVRSDLENSGFDVVKISNTFGKQGAYQGLNFVFANKDGRIFELQFHTLQSIKIKNEIHHFYEEYRVSNDQVRKSELARKMIEKWAGFTPPDNWENITDFT